MQQVVIRSGLADLVKQMEERNGRSYTIEEIARGADINRQTVKAWLDNDVKATYFETIGGLLSYLRGEGLVDIGVGDLIVEEAS